jgi:heme/copper-type cytochrome/quinol oxidase subunit 1
MSKEPKDMLEHDWVTATRCIKKCGTKTFFMEGGAPAFGWTFYAPLSTTFAPDSTDFFIFAVH